MTTETEPPAAVSRWRWLDWWCAPPWRAWLTWGALAALSGWAGEHGVWSWMMKGTLALTDLEAKASPALSNFALRLILPTNSFVLLVWFEPFVLRLSLVRGLAWIGLRLGLLVSGDFYGLRTPIPTLIVLLSFTLFVWSVLAVSVLYHWRRRPWWSVIGGVLMALTYYQLLHAGLNVHRAQLWSGWAYAAVVLFGTARLEEPQDGLAQPVR
jgi:hypothetical protein